MTPPPARAALERAASTLEKLREALLLPNARIDAVALSLQSAAADLGYEQYVRWMSLEIEGYPPGPVGKALQVSEDDPLAKRVASYRKRTGRVYIQTGTNLMELPYPWFFPDSLSRLEGFRNRHVHQGPSMIVITVHPDQIPFDEIRVFVQNQTRERSLRLEFPSSVYAAILTGLREQLVTTVAELAAAQRMFESLSALS